jgi:hypothetical protein
MLSAWVHMWDSAWAGANAFAARSTGFFVYLNCGCLSAYRKRLDRTGLHAWVIFALSTEMWEIDSGYEHENSYSRGFWPYAFLMEK